MTRRKYRSAKARFNAMGRRAASLGLPSSHKRAERLNWPMWARQAWSVGWIVQHPYQKVEAKP